MQLESGLDKFLSKIYLGNKYMPQEYSDEMFHYTSPQGFESILFKQDGIKLWASRYDCLNDMSEGTIAQQVFNDVCKELSCNKEISPAFYDIIKSCKKNKTTLFHIPKGDGWKTVRDEWDSFICSFSKNRDSLAMWNYYSKGNKYEGYNIGLSANYIKTNLEVKYKSMEVNISILPIVYEAKTQKDLITSLIKELYSHYESGEEHYVRFVLCDYLTKWSLLFKSEYFKHEEEIRVIIDVQKKQKLGLVQERPLKICYRQNCGYTIPYVELEIEKNTLTSVTIGPLQCTNEQKENQKVIMEERLCAATYEDSDVTYSMIPVRY